MKSLSTWPLVSSICALATVVVTAIAVPPDDDEGHPINRLSAKMVEQTAYFGCTNEEIANFFFISESHLVDRYGGNLLIARAKRIYELRRAQFELATKKLNGPLLIWLGRNEAGQSAHPQAPREPEPEIED